MTKIFEGEARTGGNLVIDVYRVERHGHPKKRWRATALQNASRSRRLSGVAPASWSAPVFRRFCSFGLNGRKTERQPGPKPELCCANRNRPAKTGNRWI